MRLHKDHKDWIKAVSTPEKAVEWFNEASKWAYVYESLNEVGNTYNAWDGNEAAAVDFLVDEVEAYYEKTAYDLGGRYSSFPLRGKRADFDVRPSTKAQRSCKPLIR